jgi:hypothetical protein
MNDLLSLRQMEDLELSKTRKGTKYKRFASTEEIVKNFRKRNQQNKKKSNSPVPVKEEKFFEDEAQVNDNPQEYDHLEDEIFQIKKTIEDHCHEFFMSQQMDQLNLMSNAPTSFTAPPAPHLPDSAYYSSYPPNNNYAQSPSAFTPMLSNNDVSFAGTLPENRKFPPFNYPIPQKSQQPQQSQQKPRNRHFPKYPFALIKKAVVEGKVFARNPSEPILTKEQRLRIEQNRQKAIAKRRENCQNPRL